MVYIHVAITVLVGLNLCMPMKCHGQSTAKFMPSAWQMGLYKGILGGYMSSAIKAWKGSRAGIALERAKQGPAMAQIMVLAKTTAKPRVNSRLGWINFLAQQAANASFTAIVPDPYSLVRTTVLRPISVPPLTLSSE